MNNINKNADYDFSKQNILQSLEKFIINADDAYELADAILQQGDLRLFSAGDISVVTGQPKSRKTFLISALATAFLSDNGYLGLKPSCKGKVLIVDTEQSKAHAQTVLKRIYRLMGWGFNDKHEEIVMLSLRELNAEERNDKLREAIHHFNPKFVFIDGFADLLVNTNDIEESVECINELMRISTAYNCHICSVVHANPNSEKMRGHVGSELQRKSETVLLVSKSDNITTVSPQFCRNIEFNRFAFRIDESGLPISTEYIKNPKDSNRDLFEQIFSGRDSLIHKELGELVMKEASIQISYANERIRNALRSGIIQLENKYYRLNNDN